MDVEKEGGYTNLIKNLVLKLYYPSLPSYDSKMIKFQTNSIKRYLKSHKPKIYKQLLDELSGERTLRKAKTRDINDFRRTEASTWKNIYGDIKRPSADLKEMKNEQSQWEQIERNKL